MELKRIKQLIAQDKLIKFYQSPAWRKLRLEALARDNNECQECKRKGRVTTHSDTPLLAPGSAQHIPGRKNNRERKYSLQVHHKKEVKDYPELALVLSNLETLCVTCHNEHHDRLKGFNNKKELKFDDERW